jgi:hypothetical protein
MRRSWIFLVIAVLLGGCATTTVSNLVANNNMNMVHLSRGMSKAKVLCSMRSGVSVYNCGQTASKPAARVTISNPFRSEMMEASGKTLEVLYYVTDLKPGDCAIGDDNLTPLVFEDNKLIGWGKSFLLSVLPETKSTAVVQQQAAVVPPAALSAAQKAAPAVQAPDTDMESGKAETVQAIQEAMQKIETTQNK